MNVILAYRGRSVTDADVAFVRKLIADQPALSRRALSLQVCQAWDWRQPNGVLKDAICRSLLLALHRAGQLELPAPRIRHTNLGQWRHRAAAVPIDQTPVCVSLGDPSDCPKGHGRNGAKDYLGCAKVVVTHEALHTGDACPCCNGGKV
jgi:hypothetical protein